MKPTPTPRSRAAAPVACFLCRKPIPPADLADGFSRLVNPGDPTVVEYAHDACAREAGLWDEAEGDEESDAPR